MIDRGGSKIVLVYWEPAAAEKASLLRKVILPGKPHVYLASFSPDGRYYLASGGVDHIRVWERATGREAMKWSGGSSCGFTPDGKHFLAAAPNGYLSLILYDVATGKEVRRFEGHQSTISGPLDVSLDGKTVLTGSYDLTLRLWDLETGKEIGRLLGHASVANGVVSADGKRVLSFGWHDGTVRLWDVAGRKVLKTFQHHCPLSAVAFLQNEAKIASAGKDAIRVWDVATGKEEKAIPLVERLGVAWSAISRDGSRALVPHGPDQVRLLELPSGKELCRLDFPTSKAMGLALSPDGRYGCGVNYDEFALYLWRLPEPGTAVKVR